MLRKFDGQTYQYAGSTHTKVRRDEVATKFRLTGLVKVRTVKDAYGYIIFVRPIWMDVRGRPREEYSLKWGSDELDALCRRGFK